MQLLSLQIRKNKITKCPGVQAVVRGEVGMGEDKGHGLPKGGGSVQTLGAALLFQPVLEFSRTEDTSVSWGDIPGQRRWNFLTNGRVHPMPARPYRAHRDLRKRTWL